jgi:hypothetical protein
MIIYILHRFVEGKLPYHPPSGSSAAAIAAVAAVADVDAFF